jgi:hypothetical protein
MAECKNSIFMKSLRLNLEVFSFWIWRHPEMILFPRRRRLPVVSPYHEYPTPTVTSTLFIAWL